MLKTYGDAIGTNVILAAAGGKSRKINSISRNSSGKLVEESRFHPEHRNWTTMKTKTTASIIAIPLIVTTGFSMFSGTANADQHKQIVNGREVVVHSSPIPVILHRLVPPQHGRHVTQKEVASGKTLQQRPNTSVLKRP